MRKTNRPAPVHCVATAVAPALVWLFGRSAYAARPRHWSRLLPLLRYLNRRKLLALGRQGCLPIFHEGRFVGAFSTSGCTGEQDEQIVVAGLIEAGLVRREQDGGMSWEVPSEASAERAKAKLASAESARALDDGDHPKLFAAAQIEASESPKSPSSRLQVRTFHKRAPQPSIVSRYERGNGETEEKTLPPGQHIPAPSHAPPAGLALGLASISESSYDA